MGFQAAYSAAPTHARKFLFGHFRGIVRQVVIRCLAVGKYLQLQSKVGVVGKQSGIDIPCFVHAAFGQKVEIQIVAALFAESALAPVGRTVAANVFFTADLRCAFGGQGKRCASGALAAFAAMAGVNFVIMLDFKRYAAALALGFHGFSL